MNLHLFDEDKIQAAWAYLTQLAVHQGMNLLAAVLILLGGWWLSSRVAAGVSRALDRTHVDETMRPLLGNAAQWVVRLLTVVLVLAQFGVQTASIVAMLGAAGLAIGLALQGTLQNIAAGIMLVLLRPFRVGQYIDAQGVAGTVRATGLFMTELTTFDGICLRVPNGKIWGSAITNYSENPTRRIDVPATVTFDSDIQAGLTALRGVLEAEARVLREPAFEVAAIDYTERGVTLNTRCWTAAGDMWPVKCALYERIKPALEAAGCVVAVPVRDMRLPDGQGERLDDAPPQAGGDTRGQGGRRLSQVPRGS